MNSIPLKRCPRCGKDKPATSENFNRDRTHKYGVSSTCKQCRHERAIADYKANPEPTIKKAKEWRAANRAKHRQYTHDWKLEHPAKRQEQAKLYKLRYPEKESARRQVKNAVRRGTLLKPSNMICVDCGNQANEYHHADYAKPLDVTPLCRQCHNERHPK